MKTFIVDSFTNEPFKGNPAGVCFLDKRISEEKMLLIAQEFGLSETAFVQATNKDGIYSIRYFSPKKEIPLCGHATLAAAKVIFTNKDEQVIHFITMEHIDLSIKKRGQEIVMEFPIYELVAANVPPAMLAALGLQQVVETTYSSKNKIFLLEIDDAGLLASLQPDFNALIHSYDGINGVLVTAPSNDLVYDFHYRYFWPWAGTNEDPVTGGVQTFLAKYWANKLDKKILKAFQSSSRTGYMQIELQAETILIISEAVIVLAGDLVV